MAERRLLALAASLAVVAAIFVGWGLSGPVSLLLGLRLEKLAALVVIGASIGVSTVAFQTIAANRILTPSIMGLDALYLLIQTGVIAAVGGFGYAQLSPMTGFAANAILLTSAALLFFGPLLRAVGGDVQRLLLAGVVFGVLFRSANGFLQRIIDPSEFAMIQGAMFASFGAVDAEALGVASVVAAAAALALMRLANQLDVLALGRDAAVTLGIPVRSLQGAALALTALLTATATALVGPVTFLGLLSAALAHAFLRDHRHRLLMPAAGATAAVALVVGQTMFERALGLQSTLPVIIEFAGGLFFIYLVLTGRAR